MIYMSTAMYAVETEETYNGEWIALVTRAAGTDLASVKIVASDRAAAVKSAVKIVRIARALKRAA